VTSLPDEIPISDARDHFADVVGQATYAGRITYITKRGQRVGAIVPVDVAEAAEAAEDAYLSGLAREAEEELAGGAPTRPLGEVVDELGLRPTAVPRPRPAVPGDTDAHRRS
jgi:prevent-host-death family protein